MRALTWHTEWQIEAGPKRKNHTAPDSRSAEIGCDDYQREAENSPDGLPSQRPTQRSVKVWTMVPLSERQSIELHVIAAHGTAMRRS